MNRKSGFTLIELAITITIMATLLTLAVVGLRSSQATARDEQRTTDVRSIARSLETYYDDGTYGPSMQGPNPVPFKGTYPPTDYFANKQLILDTLRDIAPESLYAPGVDQNSSPSLVAATSAGSQYPSVDTYIYQPLASNGDLCIDGKLPEESISSHDLCRTFNLYYLLESSDEVQIITSDNQ